MNLLLLGANGQLGRSFVEHDGLAELGQLTCASRDGVRFDGASIEVADLAMPNELTALLERTNPQVIVNAAAYTAVDHAESEEMLAHTINSDALGALGNWARQHEALVVHYSTDYVFDGRATQPYAVDAPPTPMSAYGRTKLSGEQTLEASGAHHLILRTAWVYSSHGRNFFRTMLRLSAEHDVLRVVADQHGTPTSTDIIVNGTIAALRQWLAHPIAERHTLEGIHHLVASGETSWYGFAQAIFDLAQAEGLLQCKPKIEAIDTAAFPTQAKRPAYSVLDNTDFQRHFAVTLPSWRDGLAAVVSKLARKDSETHVDPSHS